MNDCVIKVHAPTATILLDRGDGGNRLRQRTMDDLSQALSDLHQEKRIRAIVLSGAGSDFCLGLDLEELHEHTKLDELEALPRWIEQWERLAQLIEEMLRFPKPIIAAVDGGAVGAGFSLALACDLIVASDRATFSAAAIRNGMMGGVVAPLLSFRAGSAVASRLLLTGQSLSSRQATRIGLVTRRVASTQIWVAANELAGQCAHWPPQSLAATKRLLNETIGESLLTQLAVGAASGATICSTPPAIEGLRAFVEKRDPKWVD